MAYRSPSRFAWLPRACCARTRLRRLIGLALVILAGHSTAAIGVDSAAQDAAVKREVNSVLNRPANVAHGAELYLYCASCHGPQAYGLPAGWVPVIAGQHPRYLVKQLLDYRRSRRSDPRMEMIAKGHALRGPQDIADVVSYLGAQTPGWETEQTVPPAPEAERLYRLACSRCHGLAGEGSDARLIPRIAGQDFAYLLRQMHDVVDGRRPTMRAQHYGSLEPLDVQQLVRLAGYLAHLGASATPSASSEVVASR